MPDEFEFTIVQLSNGTINCLFDNGENGAFLCYNSLLKTINKKIKGVYFVGGLMNNICIKKKDGGFEFWSDNIAPLVNTIDKEKPKFSFVIADNGKIMKSKDL